MGEKTAGTRPKAVNFSESYNSHVFFSGLLMDYFKHTNQLDFSLMSPTAEMPLQIYPSLAIWI